MSALDKKKIRSFARGILSKSKEIDLLQVLVLSVSTAQNLKIALVSGKFQGCTSFWEERLEYTNLHTNVGIYIQRPGDPNMQRLPQPSTAALRGSPAGLGIELSKTKSDAQRLSSAPWRMHGSSVDESWSQVTETESAAVTDQVVVWPPERLSSTSLQLPPGWRYTGGMGEKSVLHCPAFLTRVTMIEHFQKPFKQ